jgi:RNA polymerase sigma-70 factor (ECF subfamily)
MVRLPMVRIARGYAEAVEQADATAAAVWRYRDDVWRLARQLCRHREDAEDVTHSALLKAAEHLDEFRWEASLRTWLHRIATNECRMLRRRKAPCRWTRCGRRRPPASAGRPSRPPGGRVRRRPRWRRRWRPETRRRVVLGLAGLPEHYRTALLLRDGLGLRAERVAEAMGVTVPAVRSILHRARSALRERLTGVQS